MKKLSTLIMTVIILIIASCSKEGPQGPAGTNGTNGTNGVDGNANVQYSDWISVDQADWTGIGTATLTKVLTEAKVTTDVIDKGVVLVYHQYLGNTFILPYAYSVAGTTFDFKLTLGSIILRGYKGDGGVISTISTVKFRYIIIPATTHVRLAKPLTEMSYEEVCNMYHIPM